MTLYYITAYHHRRNEWARFLTSSAGSAEEALEKAKVELGIGWTRHAARPVCSTNDDVFIEV